jgi:hypothetical protein
VSISDLLQPFNEPCPIPKPLLGEEASRHAVLLQSFAAAGLNPGQLQEGLDDSVCSGPQPIQIGGSAGLASVTQAWDEASGRTIGDLLHITRLSCELASRVGASMLLQDRLHRQAMMVLTEATTASALLRGCTTEQLAASLSLAWSNPVRPTPGTLGGGGRFYRTLIQVGQSAAAEAMAGKPGPKDILGISDGPFTQKTLLRGAFGLPSDAWLSSALLLSDIPGPAVFHPAIQALGEILDRHVKAADKRLRWDQVKSIEVTIPAVDGWLLGRSASPDSVHNSLPWLLSILVVGHSLGQAERTPAWISKNLDKIHHVLSRLQIRQEPRSNIEGWVKTIRTLPWLFCGIGPAEILSAIPACLQRRFVIRNRMSISQALSASTRALYLDDFQFCFPSEVLLFTTRGGRWPERRVFPNYGINTSSKGSLYPSSSMDPDRSAYDWHSRLVGAE